MAPKKNQSSAAASSLQASILSMMAKEDRGEESSRKLGTRKCETAWSRVVKAMMLLINTTRSQMVLDYLQKKGAVCDEVDPENVGDKFKKATKAKGKANQTEWIAQGIGKPLKRSTAQKFWEKEPEQCNHPAEYLRCRANRFDRWWVCLTCGSRWERFDVDHAASSTATVVPETPDSHSLKTLEGTYPQFLPAPRSKPDQGAVTLKVTNMGKISMVDGGTGSTTSRRLKTSSQETARARSASKERQMTGLRASQAAKRVPTFNIDREGTMEHLEEAFGPTEVLMISDEEKEWDAGPPHAD